MLDHLLGYAVIAVLVLAGLGGLRDAVAYIRRFFQPDLYRGTAVSGLGAVSADTATISDIETALMQAVDRGDDRARRQLLIRLQRRKDDLNPELQREIAMVNQSIVLEREAQEAAERREETRQAEWAENVRQGELEAEWNRALTEYDYGEHVHPSQRFGFECPRDYYGR